MLYTYIYVTSEKQNGPRPGLGPFKRADTRNFDFCSPLRFSALDGRGKRAETGSGNMKGPRKGALPTFERACYILESHFSCKRAIEEYFLARAGMGEWNDTKFDLTVLEGLRINKTCKCEGENFL
jgi:hypothetical protein